MSEILHGAGESKQSMECRGTIPGAQWLDMTTICVSHGRTPVKDQPVVPSTLRSDLYQ